MSKLDEEQTLLVLRQIAALRDDATAAELTAGAFQQELDACWEGAGKTGKLINAERALQLRGFVPDAKNDARYKRKLAEALETLLNAT